MTIPWALDSKEGELDVGLKAAQKIAEKEIFELPEPIVLRELLSDKEIDEILNETAIKGVWPRGIEKKKVVSPPNLRHRFYDAIIQNDFVPLSDDLKEVPHHLAWTGDHVVLYMHMKDHWFVRALPEAWARIRGGMESRPWMNGAIPVLDDGWGNDSMEDVRTIELHHYAVGGGLLNPGHRDCGSDLTISVLLSDPDEVSGGDFVTYHEGTPIAHKLARGDAILFESDKLHNIATVTSGVRQSLVVELWPAKRY